MPLWKFIRPLFTLITFDRDFFTAYPVWFMRAFIVLLPISWPLTFLFLLILVLVSNFAIIGDEIIKTLKSRGIKMNEQEIFEYLRNNLYLDDNQIYGNRNGDFTIRLKLRNPKVTEHDAILGEVDIDFPRYEQVGEISGKNYRRRW